MQILSFPDDVAIGGLDARAERLAAEAEAAAAEAEALMRALLRGDWMESLPDAEPPEKRRVA